MPELALDDDQRHALVRHLDRVRVTELMLVRTSAQASLGRPGRYAELGEEVCAGWDVAGVDVGVTHAVAVILPGSFPGEGGVGGRTDEQGRQGGDDGAVGAVGGCVPGGA
jgi:hypothetical protein